MARASETAQHLADAFDLDPVLDADFCEFDRGAKAYIPLEELDRDHPHMKALIEDWVGPGGAARREAFQAKVLAALRRHLADATAERTALVCHGGVINVILAHVLGTERMMFFQPDYTSVSRLAVHDDNFRLLSVNEAGHIRHLGGVRLRIRPAEQLARLTPVSRSDRSRDEGGSRVGVQFRGTALQGDSRSVRGSPGRPNTRSPTMFFMTSVVPPSMELARVRRKTC